MLLPSLLSMPRVLFSSTCRVGRLQFHSRVEVSFGPNTMLRVEWISLDTLILVRPLHFSTSQPIDANYVQMSTNRFTSSKACAQVVKI